MRISDWSSDVCSSDLERRGGQRGYVGQRGDEAFEIRHHHAHLGLLQHDLRQPYAVGRARVLPGKVVAAGDVEPGQQSVGERVVGAMTGHGASSPGSDGSSIVTSTRSEEHTSELQSIMRLSY